MTHSDIIFDYNSYITTWKPMKFACKVAVGKELGRWDAEEYYNGEEC